MLDLLTPDVLELTQIDLDQARLAADAIDLFAEPLAHPADFLAAQDSWPVDQLINPASPEWRTVWLALSSEVAGQHFALAGLDGYPVDPDRFYAHLRAVAAGLHPALRAVLRARAVRPSGAPSLDGWMSVVGGNIETTQTPGKDGPR